MYFAHQGKQNSRNVCLACIFVPIHLFSRFVRSSLARKRFCSFLSCFPSSLNFVYFPSCNCPSCKNCNEKLDKFPFSAFWFAKKENQSAQLVRRTSCVWLQVIETASLADSTKLRPKVESTKTKFLTLKFLRLAEVYSEHLRVSQNCVTAAYSTLSFPACIQVLSVEAYSDTDPGSRSGALEVGTIKIWHKTQLAFMGSGRPKGLTLYRITEFWIKYGDKSEATLDQTPIFLKIRHCHGIKLSRCCKYLLGDKHLWTLLPDKSKEENSSCDCFPGENELHEITAWKISK